MREPNSRLAQARERKEAFLPEIARLSLEGHTSREVAEKVGIPKTTVLRWRNSLRRECASRSVKETMEMIDKLNERYDTIYRKALEGLDRSQADEEIRTVTDCPGDDSKNKRSLRTKTRAGNPAWLTRAQAALDATAKLLKEMGMPAEAESGEEEGPIQGEELTEDDLADKMLRRTASKWLLSARQHLEAEELARTNLLAFTMYTKPDYRTNWHHELLAERLDRVAAGLCPRLMIFLPPQHGKSELVSRRFPAFVLGRNPELRLIGSSHTNDLATSMNRDVQRIMCDNAYRNLFPDCRLSDRSVRTASRVEARRTLNLFEIQGHRGGLRSAGVGKSIAGNAADGAIIDDPFGKRQDADRAKIRQRIWDWYANDLYSRLSAQAWIVLTHTRWHRDDLAGRLLRKMADRAADQWEILCLPAIREGERGDPRNTAPPGRAALAAVQVRCRPGNHPPAGRQGLRGALSAESQRRLDGGMAGVVFWRVDLGAAGEVAAGIRPAGGLRRRQQGQERQAGRLLGDRLPGRGQGQTAVRRRDFGPHRAGPARPQDAALLRAEKA